MLSRPPPCRVAIVVHGQGAGCANDDQYRYNDNDDDDDGGGDDDDDAMRLWPAMAARITPAEASSIFVLAAGFSGLAPGRPVYKARPAE